jgi:DNA-binding transcriptional ArsR family regulator
VSEAEALAESMRAFGAASRLRLLFELLPAERTVEELASAVDMEPSAVSQQLRVLRQLRFVSAQRRGRHVIYRLFDEHVAALLAAIRHHQEHAQASSVARAPLAGERTR